MVDSLELVYSLEELFDFLFVNLDALVEVQVYHMVLNPLLDIVIKVFESYFVGHYDIEVHHR